MSVKTRACSDGTPFSDLHIFLCVQSTSTFFLLLRHAMPQLTPEQKQSILTHYTSRRNDESVDSIIARHGVSVTRQSVYGWLKQWDGTVASLTRSSGSGRPRLLSSRQVQHQIANRIRNYNRSGKVVRYIYKNAASSAGSDRSAAITPLSSTIWEGRSTCKADPRQEANSRRRYTHARVPHSQPTVMAVLQCTEQIACCMMPGG